MFFCRNSSFLTMLWKTLTFSLSAIWQWTSTHSVSTARPNGQKQHFAKIKLWIAGLNTVFSGITTLTWGLLGCYASWLGGFLCMNQWNNCSWVCVSTVRVVCVLIAQEQRFWGYGFFLHCPGYHSEEVWRTLFLSKHQPVKKKMKTQKRGYHLFVGHVLS